MTVARLWLLLGVIALIVSGALSVLITGAKMPIFKPYVTDIELIRRVLVVHVNLATLVWFAAIPVALTRLAAWKDQNFDRKAVPSIFVAVAGILLMAASAFFPEAKPVLANYIPVLAHPLHDGGLALFLTGVALNYLSPTALLMKTNADSSLRDSRFGLWVGSIFFLSACVALVQAFATLDRTSFSDVKNYFEIGMWGGGHLLQHASSTFLVVCWSWLLAQSGLSGGILRHEQQRWIYALLAAPLLTLPYLLTLAPGSEEYREGFTSLMRWGIAPPMVIFILGAIFLFRTSASQELTAKQRLSRQAWGWSAFLAVLGFLFGAFIRGHDLRVPGHYHATIGAVTIAFLLQSYRLLFRAERDHRSMKPAIWLYGIGQSLFSGGMFLAGAAGVGRKTYGAEHSLDNWGQTAGMITLGVGGLIALAGGILFTVAVYAQWRSASAKGRTPAREFIGVPCVETVTRISIRK
jgi:hypothetical protein